MTYVPFRFLLRLKSGVFGTVSQPTIFETLSRKTQIMPRKPPSKPCKSAPLPSLNDGTGEGRLIGYVRVSTAEQNTDLQYDALVKAGCNTIYEDKITGVSRDRAGLVPPCWTLMRMINWWCGDWIDWVVPSRT